MDEVGEAVSVPIVAGLGETVWVAVEVTLGGSGVAVSVRVGLAVSVGITREEAVVLRGASVERTIEEVDAVVGDRATSVGCATHRHPDRTKTIPMKSSNFRICDMIYILISRQSASAMNSLNRSLARGCQKSLLTAILSANWQRINEFARAIFVYSFKIR